MPIVVVKLFAGQGTGRTDGQSGNYIPPTLGSIKTVLIILGCYKHNDNTIVMGKRDTHLNLVIKAKKLDIFTDA